MKYLALLLVALTSISTCTSQKLSELPIGKAENGRFTITENTDKIKAHWNSVMTTQKNLQPISEMSIISAVNSETRETYYLLLGKNSDGTFTIADEIFLNDGAFYFRTSTVLGTLTCTGCGYGCNPVKVGKNWCCDGGCAGNCTKSITSQT